MLYSFIRKCTAVSIFFKSKVSSKLTFGKTSVMQMIIEIYTSTISFLEQYQERRTGVSKERMKSENIMQFTI